MNTALLILAGALLVALGWRLYRTHRRRVAEMQAWDREYREAILSRARVKPRRDEEEDYLLRLRAGAKAKPAPATPPPDSDRTQNRFLD
jgi:uncharacterized membrane protein